MSASGAVRLVETLRARAACIGERAELPLGPEGPRARAHADAEARRAQPSA